MHDMTELDINVMKAALVTQQIDLERMTSWAQTLANAGTAYKKERDVCKADLASEMECAKQYRDQSDALLLGNSELIKANIEVGKLNAKLIEENGELTRYNAAILDQNNTLSTEKEHLTALMVEKEKVFAMENDRLQEALAHFAERSNWRTSGLTYDWTGGTLPYKTPWNIARAALEVKP